MSILDGATILFLALIIIGIVVIVGKYAFFLHEQHMLYMAEKSPEIRIVNPALLLPPPKPREPSRIMAAIEHGIEQATIAAMQPKEPAPLPRLRVSTYAKTDVITLPAATPEPQEEELEEEEIEEETIELEPETLDLSLEEQAEQDPGSYHDSMVDILRRTVSYAQSHDGIITRDKNSTTEGIQAVSTDSEEIRQAERVTAKEWKHAFQNPHGVFRRAGILVSDVTGRTRLHPEHQARFAQWYENYLTPFWQGLDEDEE